MNNPYDTLGVPPDATGDEIKGAFRKAAADAHPDAGGDEDAMKEISRAYMVLKDPKRRKTYDETGKDRACDEQSQVIQESIKLFMQVVAAVGDVETTNIVNKCIESIRGNMDQGKGQIQKIKRSIEKKEKALKRLSIKNSDAPNVFEIAVKEGINQEEKMIAAAHEQMARLEKMKDYFSGYQYEADIVNPMDHPDVFKHTRVPLNEWGFGATRRG